MAVPRVGIARTVRCETWAAAISRWESPSRPARPMACSYSVPVSRLRLAARVPCRITSPLSSCRARCSPSRSASAIASSSGESAPSSVRSVVMQPPVGRRHRHMMRSVQDAAPELAMCRRPATAPALSPPRRLPAVVAASRPARFARAAAAVRAACAPSIVGLAPCPWPLRRSPGSEPRTGAARCHARRILGRCAAPTSLSTPTSRAPPATGRGASDPRRRLSQRGRSSSASSASRRVEMAIASAPCDRAYSRIAGGNSLLPSSTLATSRMGLAVRDCRAQVRPARRLGAARSERADRTAGPRSAGRAIAPRRPLAGHRFWPCARPVRGAARPARGRLARSRSSRCRPAGRPGLRDERRSGLCEPGPHERSHRSRGCWPGTGYPDLHPPWGPATSPAMLWKAIVSGTTFDALTVCATASSRGSATGTTATLGSIVVMDSWLPPRPRRSGRRTATTCPAFGMPTIPTFTGVRLLRALARRRAQPSVKNVVTARPSRTRRARASKDQRSHDVTQRWHAPGMYASSAQAAGPKTRLIESVGRAILQLAGPEGCRMSRQHSRRTAIYLHLPSICATRFATRARPERDTSFLTT